MTGDAIMQPRIAFVVATKGRPNELRRLLANLRSQTRMPDEVIVVDAGAGPSPDLGLAGAPPALRYISSAVSSATRQRNLGLDAVGPEATLIGFLDDDAVLEENAVEEMFRFWEAAGQEVGGAAFNMINHPPLDWPVLKRARFAEWLGLYGRRGGAVTASGFQTMIGTVDKTEWTEWLPSTASVWRREVFRDVRFDEWFGGYSYLEDLDFSYRVGLKMKLAVVANARYLHLPAAGGRTGSYAFGSKEVLNRLYFVRKHPQFSLAKCYAALAVRLSMNLAFAARKRKTSYLARAWGNAVGLAKSTIRT